MNIRCGFGFVFFCNSVLVCLKSFVFVMNFLFWFEGLKLFVS